MAIAYTRPLGRYALTAGVSQNFPDVPEGRVWVARDLTFYNASVTQTQLYFQIWSLGSIYTLASAVLETGTSLHIELRQAIVAGERFVAFSSQGGQLSLTGYDLAAV